MNILIQLRGNDQDPVHTGDMKSWFYYYKWVPGEDNEVFYPLGEDEFPELKEGDTLWFAMDQVLVGKVPLLRVVQDDMNDRKELWYNCKDCVPASEEVTFGASNGVISDELLKVLEAVCTPKE